MNNFDEGVRIYSIDEDQGEMIIHLGELRKFHDEYKKLKEENKRLKEKVVLLQASEPMLEFAKQTYKDNWNKLKKWLEKRIKYYKIIGYVNTSIALEMVLDKTQEIEKGEINENKN